MEVTLDQPLLTTAVDGRIFRRMALWLALFWAVGFIAIFIDDNWCTEKNIWAMFVLGAGLWPFIRWFNRAEVSTIPIYELFSFFYSICFGLSSLLISERVSFVSLEQRTVALKMTLAGLFMAHFAYFGIGKSLFRRLKPIQIMNPAPYIFQVKSAWIIVWICILYRITFVNYGQSIASIHQPLLALNWLTNGIILVDILSSAKITWWKGIGFTSMVLLQLLLALASGALAQIATLIAFFCLVYLNINKRLLLKTLIIFILAFVFMNPLKHDMRASAWGKGRQESLGFMEKSSIFIELLTSSRAHNPTGDLIGSTVSRIDHGGLLAEVIRQTPENVPYALGITYAPLLTIWIPRFLWPEKPMMTLGNDWAHSYGLLEHEDLTTSFNLPWIVEFYINFGLLGILGGMFLCGLGFAYLKSLLCSTHATALEYSISVALLLPLWYAESNFALAGGGLIISAITFFVYLKFSRQFSSPTSWQRWNKV